MEFRGKRKERMSSGERLDSGVSGDGGIDER
ncbi:hypothetical protein CCACVL1_04506 [Corchorus capsularis]|uniref:Uncharacterized protein n=1 Tax=Corchorus capsularis TaxID=210143 RepID=A0A1R3JRY2_COCAP|nr:hypothetical protein CCACVL1_04506 [Corchorus capsularis]